MGVTVSINDAALDELALSLTGAVGRWLVQRAEVVRAAMIAMAPADRGQLRTSIAIEYRTEGKYLVARIGSNKKYAIYVVQGTGIYGPRGQPIKPVAGRVLAWPVYGRTSGSPYGGSKATTTSSYAFARSVKGMKGRDFMTPALQRFR